MSSTAPYHVWNSTTMCALAGRSSATSNTYLVGEGAVNRKSAEDCPAGSDSSRRCGLSTAAPDSLTGAFVVTEATEAPVPQPAAASTSSAQAHIGPGRHHCWRGIDRDYFFPSRASQHGAKTLAGDARFRAASC